MSVFFFKQKTAYEMRIGDWSSDVCSSDLVAVAYLTLMERKVLAAMLLRMGPNVVGPFGLLQPLADAAKLIFKEPIIPSGSNKFLFLAAPCKLGRASCRERVCQYV